jgi:hypothetical protein
MAWRARTDTTPAPAPSEVYAGVHAGPATHPVQPAIPQQPGMPVPPAAPSAADRARKTLRNTHRHRNQLRPWRVLFYVSLLAMTGHLTSEWIPTIRLWVMLGIVGLGAVVGVSEWLRQKRAEFRYYATACVTAATLWSLWTVKFGVWAGPGRFMPLVGLAAWLPLSWLWWERHRTRITSDETQQVDEDPFATRWDTDIRPVLKSTISDREDLAAGTAYRVQLAAGLTIEDAEQARRKIASILGIGREQVMFEPVHGKIPGVSANESVIRLLILDEKNPQYGDDVLFRGSTLERETGLYNHALGPEGPAKARLYQVENNRPHRASNSLVSGTTGSGKSRGAALKGGEHILSGLFLLWFADGQEGVSAPDLMEFADWPGDSPGATMRMLRAAYKVMKYRARLMKRLSWTDSLGNTRVGLGGMSNLPAEHRFPMIQIMIDEAQEILRDPHAARLVKALLRMGNKVGIGVDLLTQVPLLNELGGESGDGGAQVIRDMAKSGNVIVYRAENATTGMITITNGLTVDPQRLPNVKGMCYIIAHSAHPTPDRTYYASEDAMFSRLSNAPKVRLDEGSMQAAGEDYATRFDQRNGDASTDDLEDLDAELAVLLGERLPGQDAPGALAEKIPVKQAVFEIVRSANGPIKRDQISTDLAQMGLSPSKSAVDQELRWWCDRGHMEKPSHGHYDLINREGAETATAGV